MNPGFIVAIIIASYGLLGIKFTGTRYQRYVKRFGLYNRILTEGWSWHAPIIEQVVGEKYSLMEQRYDIDAQTCITKDNVTVKVDGILYWKIAKLENYVFGISNPKQALNDVVLTKIRTEIGSLDLDETFIARENLNKRILKEVTQASMAWGIEVTRLELKDLTPDARVLEAMEQQMTAERAKRAIILESEGEKQRNINLAEGLAKAEIIEAKANKEKIILEAEAEAESQKKLADAKAEAAKALAKSIQENKHSEEALRLLLAKDWMEMGQKMADAKSGSVLMIDPQSPASLIAALKQFTNNENES
jgi:regulator of protease activity HflC (stomatin/prohibitin superfamily)